MASPNLPNLPNEIILMICKCMYPPYETANPDEPDYKKANKFYDSITKKKSSARTIKMRAWTIDRANENKSVIWAGIYDALNDEQDNDAILETALFFTNNCEMVLRVYRWKKSWKKSRLLREDIEWRNADDSKVTYWERLSWINECVLRSHPAHSVRYFSEIM